jgi:hypothetical protein
MKIVYEDDTRLVLRDFPVFTLFCCLVFLGVVLASIGSEPWRMGTWRGWVAGGGALFVLALIVAIGERVEATFDRTTGVFRLHRHRIFGSKVVELPPHAITGAGIQDLGRGRGEARWLRRLVVATADSTIPLTVSFYADKRGCRQETQKVPACRAGPCHLEVLLRLQGNMVAIRLPAQSSHRQPATIRPFPRPPQRSR